MSRAHRPWRSPGENFPVPPHQRWGGGSYYGLSEDTEALAEEDGIVKALHEEDHEDDNDRAFIGDGGDLEHHTWVHWMM